MSVVLFVVVISVEVGCDGDGGAESAVGISIPVAASIGSCCSADFFSVALSRKGRISQRSLGKQQIKVCDKYGVGYCASPLAPTLTLNIKESGSAEDFSTT